MIAIGDVVGLFDIYCLEYRLQVTQADCLRMTVAPAMREQSSVYN